MNGKNTTVLKRFLKLVSNSKHLKNKSLIVTVKFALLAFFAVVLSCFHLFVIEAEEKAKIAYFIYALIYSLVIYTFGGVEKSKALSPNNLVVVFLIGNIGALVFFFAALGIFKLSVNYTVLGGMMLLSFFIFPFLVYATYGILLKQLPTRNCIVIGEKEKWEPLMLDLTRNSLISINVLEYLPNELFIEQEIIKRMDLYKPLNLIIATDFHSFKEVFTEQLNLPLVSINTLIEDNCKRIPNEVINCFEEYYSVNFSSVHTSRSARIIDTVVCLLLLFLASPVLLLASLFIIIIDSGPVLFTQPRHGHMGKTFSIFKLRTWDVGPDGNLISTKTGYLLRKLRLNEIPQLYNVLRGDMSLVGPRPDVPSTYKYCIEKIPFYHYRYHVRPGITGHAQVTYKYIDKLEVETFSNRLSYDLYYVKNNSLFFYLTTLLKTVESIFFMRGE